MLVLCCLITAALIFAFLRYYRAAQYINLRGKNICITGGSEGKKNVLIVKWKEKYGYMINKQGDLFDWLYFKTISV